MRFACCRTLLLHCTLAHSLVSQLSARARARGTCCQLPHADAVLSVLAIKVLAQLSCAKVPARKCRSVDPVAKYLRRLQLQPEVVWSSVKVKVLYAAGAGISRGVLRH